MQFEPQSITLCGSKGKTDIFAMVAVGVGLAYHEDMDGDLDTYTVTHIASGHNILRSQSGEFILDALPDSLSAERFIESIAGLLDWNMSEELIRGAVTPLGIRPRIFADLRQAYYEAVEEVDAI